MRLSYGVLCGSIVHPARGTLDVDLSPYLHLVYFFSPLAPCSSVPRPAGQPQSQQHHLAVMGSDKAPGKSKGLLFVHTTGPTHVHSRDKATKTKIRRHVMYEIGRSRRRPPRNQEFEVIMPPVESTDESTAEELTGPQTLQRPFSHQDPLSMLAEQWGMDAFSAYGISLLVAGVTSSSTPGASPSGTFFFPFAFTSSKLLAHFRSLFTNPTMLRLLHQQASARGRVLALDRYLGTISCVQNTISNPSSGHADRDKIARAVLATICYNASITLSSKTYPYPSVPTC